MPGVWRKVYAGGGLFRVSPEMGWSSCGARLGEDRQVSLGAAPVAAYEKPALLDPLCLGSKGESYGPPWDEPA